MRCGPHLAVMAARDAAIHAMTTRPSPSARVVGRPAAAMAHLVAEHRLPADDRQDDFARRANLGERAREMLAETGGGELRRRKMLDDRRLVLRVDQRPAVVARRRRPDVPRLGGRGDETDSAGDECGDERAESGHGNASPWAGAPMASPVRAKTDGIGMAVAPGDGLRQLRSWQQRSRRGSAPWLSLRRRPLPDLAWQGRVALSPAVPDGRGNAEKSLKKRAVRFVPHRDARLSDAQPFFGHELRACRDLPGPRAGRFPAVVPVLCSTEG